MGRKGPSVRNTVKSLEALEGIHRPSSNEERLSSREKKKGKTPRAASPKVS